MPMPSTTRRPALTAELSGAAFARWYWLREELTAFARELGLRTAGPKQLLAARIAAHLDGLPAPAEPEPRRGGRQLTEPLDAATVIPPGQRSSQALRAWFTEQVGPSFRFDGPLRAFLAEADGTTTLGDALAAHLSSRGRAAESIGTQFELNRFSRAWHAAHPGGDRAALLADWARYRDTPVDERLAAGLPELDL